MTKKLIVLASFLASTAAGAASELTNSAELRFRLNHNMNSGLVKDRTNTDWAHRLKWDMGYKAGEKLTGNVSLIHNNMWGFDDGESVMGDRSDDNQFVINQAYATWMLANDMSVVVGRQPIEFGDGTLFHLNDWEAQPYSFDGIGVNYDTEFAAVNFWGVKMYDFGQSRTAAPATDTDDDERNLYIFSIDVKNMPDFLKMLNIHIIKDAASSLAAGGGGTNVVNTGDRVDTTQLGFTLQGESGQTDYRLTYSMVTGEQETPAGAKSDVSTSMMDAAVGFKVESFRNSRFELAYHTDTGTDSSGDVTLYSPLFYDMHGSAGMMDIVTWGNSTYMKLGWMFELMANTMAGLDYYQFSLTEAAGADDVGSEIDFYTTKNYDNGIAVTARLGMFTPGDALASDETQTQVFVEGKFTF
ncbi:MAG: alginate export family protein [Bdellovibrionales bacterium]